ncbi:MAG: hypothetical protein ACTSVO_13580 [Candidatus Heimdallarchaeaceae archaeon]
MTFLDDHLKRVYLTENFEKSFPQVKARSGAIVESLKAGNLFKARQLLNRLPDVTLDELMISAGKAKNFRQNYLEAKRIAKGDKSEPQKMIILYYCALKSIKDATKIDVTTIDEALQQVKKFASKYAAVLTAKGFTMAFIARFLFMAASHTPMMYSIFIMYKLGVILFWFGVLLYVVRIILNTYFSIKGIK